MTESNFRAEVKDARTFGWAGAAEEGHVPVRADGAGAPSRAGSESGSRRWLRIGRRVLSDLAIVLAAMTAIPVLAVVAPRSRFWTSTETLNRSQSMVRLRDAARPFTIPSDPSISPLDAGMALAAIDQTGWFTPGQWRARQRST